MIGRRTTLWGAAFLVCTGLSACQGIPPKLTTAAQVAPGGGCLWGNAAAISSALSSRSEHSGNPRLDASLGEILAEMADILAVRPRFAFYQDGGLPNAVALPASDYAGSFGTVLFGLTMLSRVDTMTHGDLFVQAVCAHEFAHVRQYRTPFFARLDRPNSVRLVELHADFLAGYYLGRLPQSFGADALVALGRAWETLGDSQFTRREHHGTPEERIAAIEAGFVRGQQRMGIDQAAEAGARYLGA